MHYPFGTPPALVTSSLFVKIKLPRRMPCPEPESNERADDENHQVRDDAATPAGLLDNDRTAHVRGDRLERRHVQRVVVGNADGLVDQGDRANERKQRKSGGPQDSRARGGFVLPPLLVSQIPQQATEDE